MADVGAGVDVDLDQQVELARGRIDLRGDLGVRQAVCHLVGFSELAFDLDEERDHGASGRRAAATGSNPAKSHGSGKACEMPALEWQRSTGYQLSSNLMGCLAVGWAERREPTHR